MSTFRRVCATTLATLLFWGPLVPRVARAQEAHESPSNAAESIPPQLEQSTRVEADRDSILGAERDLAERAGVAVPESELLDEAAKLAEVGPQAPQESTATEPPGGVDDAEPTPLNLPTGPAKTAVTPQSIVLPKGEGSIQGMGESFTPNLSSGTGTFSIPIALPKGRAGVQPSLALSYATSSGSGVAGMGWSLAVPFISRQTDKGLPSYIDAPRWHGREDRFMYNGGQELVPVDSTAATRVDEAPVPAELASWQQYRARVEGGFMRFFRAPDSSAWVVQSKDGTRFEFGACVGAGTCAGPARVVDPESGARVFSWQLVRMSDVHGSSVHYSYTEDGGELHLDSIHYTSPASCAGAGSTARACTAPLDDYAHRVRLVYEARPDATSSYLTSWRIDERLRLKRIELTSADVAKGQRYLVRRYHLTYDENSYHSLLTSVQVEGRPSSPDTTFGMSVGDPLIAEESLGEQIIGELLPPMRFGYTKPPSGAGAIPGFGGLDMTVHESAVSPDHSADEGRADLFDVNADGLPDLLVTDPARYDSGAGVYFNGFAGGVPGQPGSFSSGVRVDIPAGLSGTLNLANLNIVPMDVDGDGRSDVLHMPRQANYGYFVLSKAPTAAGERYEPLHGWSFHHVSNLLPKGETDPRIDLGKDGESIKTLDVNNDHLIDVVRTTGTTIQTWLNLGRYPAGEGRFGSAMWTGSEWSLSTLPIESCLLYAGKNLELSDAHVRIADMNGDGLSDIALLSPDQVLWWPGRGAGLWGDGSRACTDASRSGREIRMGPARGLNTELAGVHMVDVNADGVSDLVQVGFSEISVWFNRGGQSFTSRMVLDDTPVAIDVLDRVRIADIDGSATTDIVFTDAGRWRWIDPMGGVKPRLLTTVDNGLGALTTLEYSSSALDYLRDLAASSACDPSQLDCFTWHHEPLGVGQGEAGCDEALLTKTGACVHRVTGSPVVSTVVRRVSTTDRLNALGVEETVSETEYRYHDGYYEGIEQEFRGFGAADAIVKGDEYEPTSLTRTYFHQGRRPNEIAADRLADNPNEALKGREYLTEVFDAQGKYLKTSHATYAVRELLAGLNGFAVSYAYVKSSDEYRYDTAVEAQSRAPDAVLDSVTREVAGQGLLFVSAGQASPGDAKHVVTVRHTGYARIRTGIDVVDNAGNMLQQTAWGRGGRGEFSEVVADERIVQKTTPVRVDDSICGNSGWLWRTLESYTTSSDPSVKLGYTQQVYSDCGDVRMTLRTATLPSTGAFDFSGDGRAASFTQVSDQELASTQYDTWGQPLVSCGGGDISGGPDYCLRVAKSTYDAAYQELVTQESVGVGGTGTNTTFLSTTASWDRGLGALRTATDPNGNVSEVVYDGLGRLTATFQPNIKACAGAHVPTTLVAYELTGSPSTQPVSRVMTTTLLSCTSYNAPASQLVSYAYVDGLGRPRVALAEGANDPDASSDARRHPYTASGRQIFTKKGQPRLTYQAAFFDGSPDDYRAVLARPNVPYKRALFDAFGRPTVSINEDATYSSISYHALSTDVCDEVDNGFGALSDASFVKTCTTERTDGHGRSIDQQLRQVTLDGVRENHRLWTYYRADGAVTRVVRGRSYENVLRQDSGYAGLASWVERRFVYDTLGRRIASEDPDTDNRPESALSKRTWRYLFNRVGDLVAVRDPRGCGQNFYYDLAGRLLGEAYVSCAEAQAGELASVDVPAGSVALTRTTVAMPVHVRNYFDAYPAWATTLLPSDAAAVLGRATGTEDRAQRSVVAYDARGNAVFGARQLAVLATVATLPATPTLGSDGRPVFGAAGEAAAPASSVIFDDEHTYTRTARLDHAGRSIGITLPLGSTFGESALPKVGATMLYYDSGAPRRAELTLGGLDPDPNVDHVTTYPVIERLTYTRDGLVSRTRYGDGAFTWRQGTESAVLYDARRRPVEMVTTRSPAAGRPPQTLGAVGVVVNQRLSWDGASNLYMVEDRRSASDWPVGHKPATQHIYHDALYRVARVAYEYQTPTKLDSATDWRDEEARHRAADPMRPTAAPMVASKDVQKLPNRVVDLEYRHDWLGNMSTWDDDAHAFYERSIGKIANGADLAPNSTTPALRPSALYLASNLDSTTPSDLGGWLETDYGAGGNVLAMTVHAQCTHANADPAAQPPALGSSCVDPGGTNIASRRSALRAGCACASEQHYVYRWDELNRLHEARRYDRTSGGAWTLAARQRHRYDGANQRTVKQSYDVTANTSRATLYVYPGDFERRGLEVGADGDTWVALGDTETQYLIAGARLVWQNRSQHASLIDPDHRITIAITNLIGSTSAVIDLVSGELVEAGGFYPNGAREEWLGAADELNGGLLPLEPVGFTGKEADEEVGLVYFGERYLIPRIGRWATPDPLAVHAMGGGEAGNSYHYVSGSLLQARDPLGLDGLDGLKGMGDAVVDVGRGLKSLVTGDILLHVANNAYEGYKKGGLVRGAAEALNTVDPAYQFSKDIADAYHAYSSGDDRGGSRALGRASLTLLLVGTLAKKGGEENPHVGAAERVGGRGNVFQQPGTPPRANCVQCVGRFLESVYEGSTEQLSNFEFKKNDGLPANAVDYLNEKFDKIGAEVSVSKEGARGSLPNEGVYVVFTKLEGNRAGHVMIGIKRAGTSEFFDPQQGTLVEAPKDFVAHQTNLKAEEANAIVENSAVVKEGS